MKKSDPNRGEDRLTECPELKWAKRWIRRARGGPPEGWSTKTTPDEPGYEVSSSESEPRAHMNTRAGAWTTSCQRGAVHDSACGAVFRRGFHRRVDRPRVPQNLRFPAREELAGKVTGGGCDEEIRRRRVSEGE